jgi:nifR3 family TIM-barrel protein
MKKPDLNVTRIGSQDALLTKTEGMSAPDFYIGQVPVYGRCILSPMDGYSDLPFRSMCRELGSALSYTEFANAIDILHGSAQVYQKLDYLESERPVVFQLFDNDVTRILEAARKIEQLEPDVIDINMGCSVKRVSNRGAGAGLLQTPIKVARLFRTLTRELSTPVSAKIRLGWDESSINHTLIARIIEENGGTQIAVHGRTRQQGYGGKANWDAIAEVKNQVTIPVIGNGDVRCVQDIHRLRQYTDCDGVMIGRAAIGNPWIFAGKDRQEVDREMLLATMKTHLARMLAFYDGDRGLVLFRKHLKRYLKGQDLSPEMQNRLLTCEQPQEFRELLTRAVPV